jgi:hypothetical protein
VRLFSNTPQKIVLKALFRLVWSEYTEAKGFEVK